MNIRDLEALSDPAKLAEYVASLPSEHDMESMHDATDVMETRREAKHEGHHIEIVTSYRIQVDGKTVHEHLFLDNDGRLQCHSLPNYMFVSAVDMVKSLIEAFPEDFTTTPNTGEGGAEPGAGHTAEHSHDHQHESMEE